jgi:hypothetical protein
VATIPPENLCTVLERLEVEDLNRRLKALHAKRRQPQDDVQPPGPDPHDDVPPPF